ncbi:MAG: Holliday junction branch migration DNA helicase RuvB [Metamycoplasmataceae bacterium]
MKEEKQNNLLRPNFFEEFVGQENIIKTLKIVFSSAIERKTYPEHILFYGPPGLGKTTLANILANFSKRNIIHIQGSLLLQKTDILSLFASLQKADIVFIDEIHTMSKNLEELIYSILEDYVIDIPIGPDGERKIMRMKVNPFTLIAATTKISFISKPLKDRFGLVLKLEKYSNEEITKIILNSAKKLNFKVSYEQALIIAKYSNFTPRIANRLLKRIYDFFIFYKYKDLTINLIYEVFESLSLYRNGLNNNHIQYLKILNQNFAKAGLSINTISSLLNDDKRVIENDIEPELLNHGYIIKSSRGRTITSKGKEYLQTYKTLFI